jgi:hypothetical protein
MDAKEKFMREALGTTAGPSRTEAGGHTLERVGQAPPVRPFADWDYHFLEGPIDWEAHRRRGRVPRGFATDLASVAPRNCRPESRLGSQSAIAG